jgi:phytoene dehydrogenase-like protein
MGNHNVWQFDRTDFDGMYLDARERDTIVPEACYITSASLKDPGSAGHTPAGITGIEIMTLVPGGLDKWGVSPQAYANNTYRKDPGYRALKKRLEDGLIQRLERLFPGTEETIVFRESATPVTHSRYTSASEGTGYGLACTPDQFMQKRPGYRGPVEGLFLCGASQRAGHGILGAMLSGRHTAVRVAESLGRSIGAISA